jgi:biopolymer transport protein ExbD
MAGGAVGRGRSGAITGINVTPLVDITLVLLIIFMVTAKLIVNRTAMSVDLPKASTGAEVQEILSVVLAGNGQAQVNGENVPDDDAIKKYAELAFAKDREVRAVIKADGTVQHARVMGVLDKMRQAGVGKIGFGVLPEDKAKKP